MADKKSKKPQAQDDAATSPEGYRVLARKYRPQIFSDLIGQDAMVRTLTNAFKTGRIAQAYMLTGVRGVGKTTTARLIARALNYTLTDGPSIDMPEMGEHCQAILESRHIDVIEMDAASNTGIDDVREIIEAVRYKPVSARYKVYIIDEVHMLSRQAFNGLLKTLEEPPEHVKFIFATTEVRKVPVTVLSRCQRFDLRRVDTSLLVDHFQKIADAEGVKVADEALALIARASEGSVRDGLSLLDQAIAHGASDIADKDIRDMLGLVDRAQVIDLFEQIMKGEAAQALSLFENLYDAGGDPITILSDLAELVHLITRFKVADGASEDVSLTQAEKTRGRKLADELDMRVLARAWQMLLKGLGEVQQAGNARAAVDMVLVRMAYIADMPSPEEIISKLEQATAASPAKPQAPQGAPQPAEPVISPQQSMPSPPTPTMPPQEQASDHSPIAQQRTQTAPEMAYEPGTAPPAPSNTISLQSFGDVVKLLGEKRDVKLKSALEHSAHLVNFRQGHIELRLQDNVSGKLANDLGRKLSQWTGERWIVVLSREQGDETIAASANRVQNARLEQARLDPLVAAALEAFPKAEIVEVRDVFAQANLDNPEVDEDINSDD